MATLLSNRRGYLGSDPARPRTDSRFLACVFVVRGDDSETKALIPTFRISLMGVSIH